LPTKKTSKQTHKNIYKKLLKMIRNKPYLLYIEKTILKLDFLIKNRKPVLKHKFLIFAYKILTINIILIIFFNHYGVLNQI